MPVRDLDQDWEVQRPPILREDLEFTFMGEKLVRLPEVPLVAFVRLEATTPDQETTAIRQCIRDCLAEESRPVWDRIVGRPADGDEPEIQPDPRVTIARVMQVWRHLVQAGSGRPTERASDSSSGRSSSGMISTDGPQPNGGLISRPSEPGGSPTLHTTSAAIER